MSGVAKYEKKMKKASRKLECLSDSEAENDLRKKIAKYEKKIARVQASDAPVAAPAPVSAPAVDKSGLSLLLFYAYVEPPWSHKRHLEAIDWANATLARLDCTGRLRCSREGFNGTLTGSYSGLREFTSLMREYDSGRFAWMNDVDDFKLKDGLPLGQKFPQLKVFSVKELVNYGIGVDGAPSVFKGGVHLDPDDYDKKLHEVSDSGRARCGCPRYDVLKD